MKAIIKLDVPEWQIGQDVTVHFPDTMVKHEKCELLKEQETIVRCKDCYYKRCWYSRGDNWSCPNGTKKDGDGE